MIGASINIPDLLQGELIIDESTLALSLSDFERMNDGNLTITVMSGNMDMKSETMPDVAYGMKYKQSRCVLRLQEVKPEESSIH